MGPPSCWQGEEASGAVLWLGKERSAVCRMTLVTIALPGGVIAGPSAEPNLKGSDVGGLPGQGPRTRPGWGRLVRWRGPEETRGLGSTGRVLLAEEEQEVVVVLRIVVVVVVEVSEKLGL